ncbi:MAG: hypothetical protein C4551_10115 [Bacillota bacterium]|jgi:uncharacterized protein YndB with AHSA1/START domain|nr:MAG: hypothetical protein C4551_10115 [Bacillota bacterium]
MGHILGGNPIDENNPLAVRLYGPDGQPLLVAGAINDAMDQAPTNVLSVAAYLIGRNPDTGQGQRVSVRDADTDAQATSHKYLKAVAAHHAFGGTNWERWRNNVAGTLLPSAVRNALTSSADQINYNCRGVWVRLNVTVNPGGGQTLALRVDARSNDSNYTGLAVGAGADFGGGVGNYDIIIYPGVGAAGGGTGVELTANFPLPRVWRATVTPSGAGNWTYSVEYAYIV